MGFDPDSATRASAPGFKFLRLKDGVELTITAVDDPVESTTDDGEIDKNLVVTGTVVRAKGGSGDKDDLDSVTDVAAGDEVSVWARYERDGRRYADGKAKAIGQALIDAKARELLPGGTLTISFAELGPKNANNPSWSRPKKFKATYIAPPAGFGKAIADFDTDEEPF